MSDQPQPPPPPSGAQPVTGYGAQPVTGYSHPSAAPPGPPKKRRGWIIAGVVVVALLLCGCCAVAGFIAYLEWDSSTSSSVKPDEDGPNKLEPGEQDRLDEWQTLKDSLVRQDYTYVEPDERMRRCADAMVAQILPDFRVEELKVSHNEPVEGRDYEHWDNYLVRLALSSDPDVQLAAFFWVTTADWDTHFSSPEDVQLESEDQRTVALEGGGWGVYDATDWVPLYGGTKDDSYADLLRQAMDDFPGGVPSKLSEGDDGAMQVDVVTWDSYCWSDSYDHMKVTYRREGDVWKAVDWSAVMPDAEGTEQSSGD